MQKRKNEEKKANSLHVHTGTWKSKTQVILKMEPKVNKMRVAVGVKCLFCSVGDCALIS